MSTVDIDKVLQSEDVHVVGDVIKAYNKRLSWTETLREVQDSNAPGDLVMRGFAEAALAQMKDEPVISPLDALRVDARILQLAKKSQWRYMMDAREHGASWDAIADAAGMPGGGGGEDMRRWYVDQITTLNLPENQAARARAVIDDVPTAQPPAADTSGVAAVVDDPPADGES